MTTERRQYDRGPRLGVSPLELRLYLITLLAAVYTISWRAIGGHVPEPEPRIATTPQTSDPQRFVWIDNLPPSMRPAIVLPAGWRRASEPESSATAQPPRVVRVPSRDAPRVRTRSS